jgi:hypothetical protein
MPGSRFVRRDIRRLGWIDASLPVIDLTRLISMFRLSYHF